MKLNIAKRAFERYRESAASCEDDFHQFQSRLRQASEKDLIFLEWGGKPAVYFDRAYWRYAREDRSNVVTLIGCLGILEYVGLSNRRMPSPPYNNERRASG